MQTRIRRITVATILVLVLSPEVLRSEGLKLSIKVVDGNPGAQVDQIFNGGVGAQMKLEKGDVIVRVNGNKVTNMKDLTSFINNNELTTLSITWKKNNGKFYSSTARLVTTTPLGQPPKTEIVVGKPEEVKAPK